MIRMSVMAGLAALILAAPAQAAEALMVNEINVSDPAKFQTYADQVPATLKAFGGAYLVRGGSPEQVAGPPPAQRVVIVRFPDRAAAKAWHASAAYQKILPIREASSTSTVFVVDMVAP